MKKLIFMVTLCAIVATGASAQKYDKVFLSYDNAKYANNATIIGASVYNETQLNGVGIGYIHGFGIANNVYVEGGANLNFLSRSKDKITTQNLNATIPVNVVYALPITESVTIDPYLGLNAKLNIVTRAKANNHEWADYHNCKTDREWGEYAPFRSAYTYISLCIV